MQSDLMHSDWPTGPEAASYYYGLPTNPRLVARTGTAQFKQPQGDVGPRPFKVLCRVGPHDIAGPWHDGTLTVRIMNALRALRWTAIDVVRIGYAGGDFFPVTILVSVEPSSTGWPEGKAAVDVCEQVLHDSLLFDVNVEIKEGVVFNLVNHKTAPPRAPPLLTAEDVNTHERYIDDAAPLSELVGTEISLFDLPTYRGTKGCYLRDRKNGDIYALTCRHVVLPNEDNTRDFTDPAVADYPIIQASEETTTDHTPSVAPELRSLWGRSARPQDRIIGHVVCAPRICSVGSGPATRMRDWALIKLHPGKHTTPLRQLQNRVWTASNFAAKVRPILDKEIAPALRDKYPAFTEAEGNDNFSMELKGILHDSTLRKPPHEVKSKDEPSIVVMKHGAATGLTVGVSNNIRSVTRRHNAHNGAEVKCMEWCIVLQKHWDMIWQIPFSKGGDSGSVVFDTQGLVCGMVTSGNGQGGRADVTYASTIEWLLKDMGDNFGYHLEVVGDRKKNPKGYV